MIYEAVKAIKVSPTFFHLKIAQAGAVGGERGIFWFSFI